MRHRSFLVAPLVAVVAVAGCSKASGVSAGGAPQLRAMPSGVSAALIARGDSIFNTGSCQRCHGQKGVGARNGPSLVAGPWVQIAGRYEEIVTIVTTGVPKAAIKDIARPFPMNPRGGPMNLTDEQVKSVAAYVWSISRDKR
jgi:mono/diheme cytochrome c family protein